MIVDDYKLEDDLEKLKVIIENNAKFRYFYLRLAYLLDYRTQNWFYDILGKSGLFKVVTSANPSKLEEVKALIDFNGIPSVDNILIATQTIFGVDAYVETPNSVVNPSPAGVLRVYVKTGATLDNIQVLINNEPTTLSLGGETLEFNNVNIASEEAKQLLFNFVMSGVKLEIFTIA